MARTPLFGTYDDDGPIGGGPAEPPVEFDPGDDDLVGGGPGAPPVPIDPGGSAPPAPPPPPPGGGAGAGNQDANQLPPDIIGDIPPPPLPPPPPIEGIGPAGIPGTEGSTFARPGSSGINPFRTPAFTNKKNLRFGPGVPTLGGGSAGVSGLGEGDELDLSPDVAAEILRNLAAGRQS